MRYFRGVGKKAMGLGGALAAVLAAGWLVGWLPALPTFLTPPILMTGVAMWRFPGQVGEAGSFEEAWAATRVTTKLVWLVGFSLGTVVMMAAVFFVIAPASGR